MGYQTEKIRYISHEVKNQLSICDLYSEIITKYCEKNNIKDETILKSVNCIRNAVIMAGHSLLELKSSDVLNIKTYKINSVLEEVYNLAKAYGINKSVEITLIPSQNDTDVNIDKDRFMGVVINLVKNACEAFSDEKNKQITIKSTTDDKYVKIHVINNAKPIDNPDEIFSDGFTTKQSGSGIGLFISKQNMEEMSGYLKLTKSDNVSTEFEIGIER